LTEVASLRKHYKVNDCIYFQQQSCVFPETVDMLDCLRYWTKNTQQLFRCGSRRLITEKTFFLGVDL